MVKYINADKLKKLFDETSANADGYCPNNVIDMLPAADVRRIKRGKWKFYGYNRFGEPLWECSVCKGTTIFNDAHIKFFRYCPRCGSAMSEEGEKDG